MDQAARVEVVARAIHAELNSGVAVQDSPLSWETERESLKDWHRRAARAALAADAMIEATYVFKFGRAVIRGSLAEVAQHLATFTGLIVTLEEQK